MKKLIKQMIYKLMGDSRRDIIAELKYEEAQILRELSALRAQFLQAEQAFKNQIDTKSDIFFQRMEEQRSFAENRLLGEDSPLLTNFLQMQELLRQEASSVREQVSKELSSAENRLLGEDSPLLTNLLQIRNLLQEAASVRQEYARIEQQLHIHMELVGRDTLVALSGFSITGNPLYPKRQFDLRTDYPVAYESPDHLHPWGTKNDNTRAPFFIRKCETLFPEKESLCFADLGCSGGGIVLDALLRGHQAIGLEGSDYSLKKQRAEWRLLRNNLFTCDIAKPFSVLDLNGEPVLFDIVSAWEVFEHIPRDGVVQMIENIAKMLAPGGYFVGTVSQTEDHEPESGAALHLTIQPAEWWYEQLENAGLERVEGVFERCDLARASGNPPLPWLINWGQEESPYLVVRKPIVG